MSLPAPLRHLAAPPLFIVGVPRSGTTWLFDILTAHPQVGGVFESFLFDNEHGLGAVAGQPHWNLEFAQHQRDKIGHSAGVPQLLTRDELRQDLRELTGSWLARALQGDDARRYLVAKENAISDLPLISELLPDARFVHILRDGRDVMVSHRAAARTWAPEMRLGRRATASTYAKRWRNGIGEIRKTLASLNNDSIEVRYEMLRQEQLEEQERVFSFAGIPYDAKLGDEIMERTAFEQHAVTGRAAFRRKGSSGAWRSSFRWFDAPLYDRGAGDLLVELGYETDRRWWVRGGANRLRRR